MDELIKVWTQAGKLLCAVLETQLNPTLELQVTTSAPEPETTKVRKPRAAKAPVAASAEAPAAAQAPVETKPKPTPADEKKSLDEVYRLGAQYVNGAEAGAARVARQEKAIAHMKAEYKTAVTKELTHEQRLAFAAWLKAEMGANGQAAPDPAGFGV
jgi:hypothetical protein